MKKNELRAGMKAQLRGYRMGKIITVKEHIEKYNMEPLMMLKDDSDDALLVLDGEGPKFAELYYSNDDLTDKDGDDEFDIMKVLDENGNTLFERGDEDA